MGGSGSKPGGIDSPSPAGSVRPIGNPSNVFHGNKHADGGGYLGDGDGMMGASPGPMYYQDQQSRSMRETALGMIDAKIANIEHRLVGLKKVREFVDGLEKGSTEEGVLWEILQGGFRRM